MILSLIAAMSQNRVIGRAGGLPWKLPDDMKFFMRTTTGHTILMGRKTWESFPGGKALPNRRHLVISRQPDYIAQGAEVVATLDQALKLAAGDGEVFVIGGGQIYEQAIRRAQRIYLTLVHGEVEGDVLFPRIDPLRWSIVDKQHHPADERHAYAFTFIRYELNSR